MSRSRHHTDEDTLPARDIKIYEVAKGTEDEQTVFEFRIKHPKPSTATYFSKRFVIRAFKHQDRIDTELKVIRTE